MQLISYSKFLCLFCSLALVYSSCVPSQPVISQPDAVLKPNLATLFFFITNEDIIIKKKKKKRIEKACTCPFNKV